MSTFGGGVGDDYMRQRGSAMSTYTEPRVSLPVAGEYAGRPIRVEYKAAGRCLGVPNRRTRHPSSSPSPPQHSVRVVTATMTGDEFASK